MNSVQIGPKTPGSWAGGTNTKINIVGDNIPIIDPNDIVYIIATGMTPNKSLSVYFPGQEPAAQQFVGFTDSTGALMATYTGTGTGSLAAGGMMIGYDIFMLDETKKIIVKGSISTVD